MSGAGDIRRPRAVSYGGVHNVRGAERVRDEHDSVHADRRWKRVFGIGDSNLCHVSATVLLSFSASQDVQRELHGQDHGGVRGEHSRGTESHRREDAAHPNSSRRHSNRVVKKTRY